jgi:hypothetical protein
MKNLLTSLVAMMVLLLSASGGQAAEPDKMAQAREELEKALQARRHAISPQGLEENHRDARGRLQKLGNP